MCVTHVGVCCLLMNKQTAICKTQMILKSRYIPVAVVVKVRNLALCHPIIKCSTGVSGMIVPLNTGVQSCHSHIQYIYSTKCANHPVVYRCSALLSADSYMKEQQLAPLLVLNSALLSQIQPFFAICFVSVIIVTQPHILNKGYYANIYNFQNILVMFYSVVHEALE